MNSRLKSIMVPFQLPARSVRLRMRSCEVRNPCGPVEWTHAHPAGCQKELQPRITRMARMGIHAFGLFLSVPSVSSVVSFLFCQQTGQACNGLNVRHDQDSRTLAGDPWNRQWVFQTVFCQCLFKKWLPNNVRSY